MKKSTIKPKYTTRIEAPIAKKEKDGSAGLYCPFCKPTHKILPGMEYPCGTRIEVRAAQMVFKAKYEKNMVCAKCRKGGGEMVRFQNAFIHTHDCTPGVATFTEPPKFSKIAEALSRSPEWLKDRVEKRFGKIMPVDEVTPDGTRTGVVLGYFFYKG
jgi:hypothetical protein